MMYKKFMANILIIAFIFSVAVPALANEVSSDTLVEHIPMYSELTYNGTSLGTVNIEEQYEKNKLQLISEEESYIRAVLAAQKSGAVINWGDSYLNKIKDTYPEIYSQIVKVSDVQKQSIIDNTLNPLTRAEKTDTFEYITHSSGPLHTKICTLRCTVRWMWDSSNNVYGVYPSSSLVVHDPFYQYMSGNDNGILESVWNSSTNSYYVQGAIESIDFVGGVRFRLYPYMKISLTASSGYIIDSGEE